MDRQAERRLGDVAQRRSGCRAGRAEHPGNVGVSPAAHGHAITGDLALWQAILNSTDALSFNNYLRFMNLLFCGRRRRLRPAGVRAGALPEEGEHFGTSCSRRLLPFTDTDAYRVVKAATEAFVMVNCGILAQPRPFDDARDRLYFARARPAVPDQRSRVPSSTRTIWSTLLGGERSERQDATLSRRHPRQAAGHRDQARAVREIAPEQASACHGILQEKLTNPCLLELIWSYWHEEGMLVQTLNAITRRFQNVRGRAAHGSAGQSGDRSAAPAQQPPLGLRPGRAAPAERRPPQLRVRPSLRAAAARQGRPEHQARRIRARSSSKRSTTCCACARCSSGRTTTRR